MLAIRMQRIGRKGLPQYRIVVQDSRRTPHSGNVVAKLGSYNPHTKEVILDKAQAADYLQNGAQPSDRVVHLFKQEKIELPTWVNERKAKQKTVRKADKLRKNQPAQDAADSNVEQEVEAPAAEVAE